MRVFMTGAGGYVGSHAATALASRGHVVAVLARSERDRQAAAAAGYAVAASDLTDTGQLTRAVQAADAVLHCAASDDPAFLPVNRVAIEAMLAALQPGQALAVHGGSMVYGDTGPLARDADALFAPPPPLEGRASLDRAVLDHGTLGLRTFVVYAALVHGGAGAMVPRAMTSAVHDNGFAGYVGDGSQLWSSVHVEDWAVLMALALERGPAGGHAFVAAGPPVSLRDAAALAAAASGKPGVVRSVEPDEAVRLWRFFGPAFGMSQHFSADKAARLLGWTPPHRDLAASFAEAAANTVPASR